MEVKSYKNKNNHRNTAERKRQTERGGRERGRKEGKKEREGGRKERAGPVPLSVNIKVTRS